MALAVASQCHHRCFLSCRLIKPLLQVQVQEQEQVQVHALMALVLVQALQWLWSSHLDLSHSGI